MEIANAVIDFPCEFQSVTSRWKSGVRRGARTGVAGRVELHRPALILSTRGDSNSSYLLHHLADVGCLVFVLEEDVSRLHRGFVDGPE